MPSKSKNTITISVFHNGQLGTERDNVEACQLGNLDIAVVNQSVLTNFIPEIAAFDLPYVIQGTSHADKVFLGEIGKEYLKKLSSVKLQGVAIWESGFRNLTNSKRPINALEDVAGLRIRVMENAIHQALWKSLGADPVPMAWGDAYTAMQQGAIDGQENPSTVIDKNNVVEVTKNMAITEHVYSTVYIIMSLKAWKSLNAENQSLIESVMAGMNTSERELSRKMDKEAITTLEGKGMKVTYPDKQRFVAATQAVREKFGEAYKDILNRIDSAK
jgi:tripartite ATP-independent transporter DctP family solute receptor